MKKLLLTLAFLCTAAIARSGTQYAVYDSSAEFNMPLYLGSSIYLPWGYQIFASSSSSVANPGYSFRGYPSSGFSYNAVDQSILIGITGTGALSITKTEINTQSTCNYNTSPGSNGKPGYAFGSSYASTGMYLQTGSLLKLSFAVNSVPSVEFSSSPVYGSRSIFKWSAPMLEATTDGVKFPDGTIQDTAFDDDLFDITETSVTIKGPTVVDELAIKKANSTYGDLALYFLDDAGNPINSGIRCHTGEMNSLVFTINGVESFKIGPNLIEGLSTVRSYIYKGSAGLPGYSFTGDTTTGLFNVAGTHRIGFTSDGVQTGYIDENEMKLNVPLEFPDGTVQTTAATAVGGCTDHGPLATAPGSPSLCDEYFDTTTFQKYIWNGTSWVIMG